ncbi:hypothetical protein E6W39_36295 [Kitasatospora acidiphila]|uniref:GHMP kinase N-terminal domain-containing protein n=1 Tax=Kitasatospora acidiphila TaxID=2567942 RepID=A0A540WC82_9ACTN|nr:hypothetical protein [Kitasatospora acidiphila]TQF06661.1 hypothetical protein E6W39_36295 [Kitasatospora acidiphila]
MDVRQAIDSGRAVDTMELVAHAAAHGSLGELWQGPVPYRNSERIGLVTLPILRHSYASFYAGGGADGPFAPLTAKRQLAITLYARRYGVAEPTGYWEFTSDLPIGHGMSSSTADVVAVLRCLDMIFDNAEDPEVTRSILGRIERSDPIYRDQYCLYLSGAQVAVREYESSISYNVCYTYAGAPVRTRDFDEPYLLREYRERIGDYRESLRRLDDALVRQDAAAVAAEATESARLAQAYLPNPLVGDLLRDHRELGGIGVIRAHTGTVAGILFDSGPDGARRTEVSRYFLARGRRCYFTRGGYPLV